MQHGAASHGRRYDRRLPAFLLGTVAMWASALSPNATAEDYRYVVRPGDNPWNLTQRFLKGIVYWPRIQQYNRIVDATAMQPGTTLHIPVGWMRAAARQAEIADLRGDVFLERGGEPAQAAAAGMPVAPGATLRTSDEGSVSLQFPDGSRTLIGPGTVVRLVELRRLTLSSGQQTRFELQQGEMENEVAGSRGSGGRFVIQAPAATAAVRGTRFRVASAADGMRNETLQGTVALQNRKGSTLLRAGTGAHVRAGAAPGAAQPLLPAPVLDALPARIERLPARLEIPAVAGAHAYRSQIFPATGAAAAESDRSGPTAHVLSTGDLPDGVHRLRVRAIGEGGLEGLDAEREIVIDARPEPPFLHEPPSDGWVVDEHPAFRWARSSDAARYHFQLAAERDFHAPLVVAQGLESPEWIAGQPLAPGVYFWRVAVETDAEGLGPYSDPQRFTLPPPGPQPQPPEIDGDTMELRWRAGNPGERFQVQISRDPAFAAPEIDRVTDEARLSMPRPEPGLLHLRVRTLAPDTPPGPWGKAQQVEIPHSHWRALLILVPVLLIAL